jgi:hypothetical protein
MAQAHKTQVTGWVGWIGVASFLMFLAGILHIIYGIAALFSYSWYVTTASGGTYLFDLTQWGWTLLIGGVLLIITGMLLFTGNLAGRIIGGIIVALSLIANVSLLTVAPIWSIIAIVFDVLILYAIIAHGSEMKHLDDEMS